MLTESNQVSSNYPPLLVGVTGGIGSGKSTICKIFEQFEIPVYYADERAKQIMVEDHHVIDRIKNLLGNQAYFQDGSLNKTFIAEVVFSDPQKLKGLNGIVHPVVGIDSANWHSKQTMTPYTIKEAALLIESGSFRLLDKLIVVYAPKEVRIERVVKRDKINRGAVLSRMDKQMPEDEKLLFADFVIHNNGRYPLIKQVWKIHQLLVSDAIKRS